MKAVRLKIVTYGVAPRRYGPSARKVGLAAATLMQRAGWTRVGAGREYVYVVAPDGAPWCPPLRRRPGS